MKIAVIGTVVMLLDALVAVAVAVVVVVDGALIVDRRLLLPSL